MDILLLIVSVVGAVAVGALASGFLLRSSATPDERETASEITALAERLSQMTEAQAAQQAQFAQPLQAQERALAKSVDDRLQILTGRINETLEKTNKTQKTNLDELKERLIRIDAALVDKKLARLDMPATGGPHESVAPEGVLLDHGIPTFLDGFLHPGDVPARG